jgi:hypothetical protein
MLLDEVMSAVTPLTLRQLSSQATSSRCDELIAQISALQVAVARAQSTTNFYKKQYEDLQAEHRRLQQNVRNCTADSESEPLTKRLKKTKTCRRCGSPAAPGNFGFCAQHCDRSRSPSRSPSRSTSPSPPRSASPGRGRSPLWLLEHKTLFVPPAVRS